MGLFAAHVLEHLSYEDAVICIQIPFQFYNLVVVSD